MLGSSERGVVFWQKYVQKIVKEIVKEIVNELSGISLEIYVSFTSTTAALV